MSGGHIDGASNFHPYECNGAGECVHCDRRVTEHHDPATCALCDPDYDYAPNERRGTTTDAERPSPSSKDVASSSKDARAGSHR